MFYSSTKYDSFMDWVFSFGGIITIALIILAIWLIYNYFQKKNDDNNSGDNQLPKYYPQSKKTIYDNQYNSEFGADESFWDDVSKINSQQGTNIYPTREEEPVPPNAIPPSSMYEEDVKIYEKSDGFSIAEEIIEEEKENE